MDLSKILVDSLFMHKWEYSVRNWVYVMLSRVKTRLGLCSRNRIDVKYLKKFNDIPQALTTMLEKFRRFLPVNFSENDYKNLFDKTTNF